MRFAAAVLALATTAGCSADAPAAPTGPVNEQVTLAPRETTVVVAAGIAITFQGVMGDSRCPADVVCIQGGDAIVRIDVRPGAGGSAATFDLHTGNGQPATYQDLTIALENLSPYPFSSRPIGPNEYRATLHITR